MSDPKFQRTDYGGAVVFAERPRVRKKPARPRLCGCGAPSLPHTPSCADCEREYQDHRGGGRK